MCIQLRTLCIVAMVAGLACWCSALAEPLFVGEEAIPTDAMVLFDGKSLSSWTKCGSEEPAPWKVENGYMEAHGGNICSTQKFGDCQLHVEFWLPLMADRQGQARANSGVFLQGAYEIQILDSYGLKSGDGDCGAIYSIHAPTVNANRPPERWQTYDIFFRAPRFDADGKKIANARFSVLQNGVWIHDCAEAPYPTANHGGADPKEPGPIVLQDHGCPIRIRNVWIRPLKG